MKKKLGIIVTSLLLIVTLMATLCGCSSFGKIKSAFEKEGYTESEKVTSIQETAIEAIFGEDYESLGTVHVFTKSVLSSVVLEFNSTSELTDRLKKLTEDETIGKYVKDAVEDIQKCPIVNGNCVLVYGFIDGLEIFQSTK